MRPSKSRRFIASLAIVFALSMSAISPHLRAQSPAASFTVDDLLDVANVNIADLSDDGKWLAVTSGTLRDRIGIDNHRFGDPTYIAPSAVEVLIVDTHKPPGRKSFFPPNGRCAECSGRRMARGWPF